MTNRISRGAIACALLATTAPLSAAVDPLPPDTMVVTPGGVDLRSGSLRMNKTLLSMGEGQPGALEFRRIMRSHFRDEPRGRMGQFNHNWDIRFKRKTRDGGTGVDVIVTSDELSFTFLDFAGVTLTSNTGYAQMTKTDLGGGSYYYTMVTGDGTTVVSRPFGSGTVDGRERAASVTKADGTTYTLTYDALGASGQDRLRRVTSNAGYALLLEYASTGGDALVSKACAINLATTVAPAPNNCPAGVPTVSYAYSGEIATSETDATGAVWGFTSTYGVSPYAFTETYTYPGASSPYLTVNYELIDFFQNAVVSQTLADGRHFTYAWGGIMPDNESEVPMAIVSYGYTENGGITGVSFSAWRPNPYVPPRISIGPTSVTDPIGRTTTFDYCLETCSYVLLRSKTLPEGMKATYHYDSFHHVDSTTITPNTGSSLPAITTSAVYDCSLMINCDKPTSKTDPKGNVTTYEYSTTHGGILKETKPAVGGVTPQTRYSYAQRYAWISNGSGGYVQASSPVWLLTQESMCRTGAPAASGTGCAIAGDEVITTYDYGPNSGPNTLLLRGKVVTADGQSRRTCFTYDSMGRKVSETSPRAALSTCP